MAKTKKSPAKAQKSREKEFITKDMTLGEVLQKHPESAEVMSRHGLHCIGCHISAFETIEQGAAAHGIDLKKFLDDLNAAAGKKK